LSEKLVTAENASSELFSSPSGTRASWIVLIVTGPIVRLSEMVVESRPPPSTETPSLSMVRPKSNSMRLSCEPSTSWRNGSGSLLAMTKALFFSESLTLKPSFEMSTLNE
jgi:hypothetical protein